METIDMKIYEPVPGKKGARTIFEQGITCLSPVKNILLTIRTHSQTLLQNIECFTHHPNIFFYLNSGKALSKNEII